MLGEHIAEALTNIRAQGTRSLLALLGILIGTASIVAMLQIGHITQRETLKLFSTMGIDMLVADAAPTGGAPVHFARAAIETLPAQEAGVVGAAPLDVGRAGLATLHQAADMPVVGATAALFDLAGLAPASGRALTSSDDGALVVVLGDQARAKLATPGDPVRPGEQLRVGAYLYTVIGILGPVAPTGLDPVDYANAAFIPLGGSGRVLAGEIPTSALIRVATGADQAAIAANLQQRFTDPATTLQIRTARDIIATMNAQKAIDTHAFLAVGSISLLVGGIGVMNVMLMGIMERRTEIGLRAAIGAAPRDLQLMFVAESAILALIGGSGGAAVGTLVAWIVSRASQWEFSLAPAAAPLGILGAACIGVVFGLHPAIRASRMKPIEALSAQ
jgi:putative ABC transport system permease protein